MTTKREKKKDEQKAAKQPKLKTETVKDLDAKHQGEGVRGGAACLRGGNTSGT